MELKQEVKVKVVPPAADLIARWQEAKEILDNAKALEIELREEIVSTYFKEATDAGTYRETVGNHKVTCVRKMNYKLDPVRTLDAQTEIAKIIGHELTTQLVNWKPDLSLRGYAALSDEARKIVDNVLTITPAKPTIEVK